MFSIAKIALGHPISQKKIREAPIARGVGMIFFMGGGGGGGAKISSETKSVNHAIKKSFKADEWLLGETNLKIMLL